MWVEPYKKKFRIRDLIDGRKVTLETGFVTDKAAKARKKALEVEKEQNGGLNALAGQANFGEWAEGWWHSHEKTLGSSETKRTEGGRFRKHVIGRLGHLKLKEIKPEVIRHWLDDLADPDDEDEYKSLSTKSILNVHGYLYMALERAIVERMIRTNPAGASRLPKWHRPEPRFLTDMELGAVIGLLPEAWRPLFIFISGTGCRVGEAIGLKWDKVNLDENQIRFESQLRTIDGVYTDVPLKTRFSRRTIKAPPTVKQILRLLPRELDGYVFRGSRHNKPVYYNSALMVWTRALEGTAFEGLRIHDLRHTHAAQLIKERRPLTSIQRRLGHSSIKITSDLYGGLLPEVEEETAEAAERSLRWVDLSYLGIDRQRGGEKGGEFSGSHRRQTPMKALQRPPVLPGER
ncbi:tyrosine-type recombinase/integrase [Salininema proteolyticum]|uniref:Tyrosine-type recombinase/integrase n=1 Tax=Salininema proteolyticum TaxID=1607685 RepID=A0ABV8TT46_9ACTN